jgi:PEGA domain
MRNLSYGIAFALLTSLASASPESDLTQAKTFFSAGATAYSTGRYEESVTQFEEAYRLAPKPQVLFSLAQAERRLFLVNKRQQSTLKRAVEHYERYVSEPGATRREDATSALAELVPQLKSDSSADTTQPSRVADPNKCRLTLQVSIESARISLDDGALADAPLIVETTPGKHRARVTAEGYRDGVQDVVCEPGKPNAREISMSEKPAILALDLNRSADVYVDGKLYGRTGTSGSIEVPAGTYSVAFASNGAELHTEEVSLVRGREKKIRVRLHDSAQRSWSYIAFVSGGVLLTGSTLFALGALGEQTKAKDLLDKRDRATLTQGEFAKYTRSIDARDSLRTYAFVTLGLGAGVLGAGLLAYAFDRPVPALMPNRRKEEPDRTKRLDTELSALPWIDITGGTRGAILQGTF